MHILKNILVPIDFSEYSHKALRYAEEISHRVNATLHILHVLPPASGEWGYATGDDVAEQMYFEAEEALGHIAEHLKKNNVPVRTYISKGYPEQQIVKFALEHRVDTIVMGTKGRREDDDYLVGSTTERVLRSAPCPVLFVRVPEHQEEGYKVEYPKHKRQKR